jgi:hypothetical protein
MSSRRDRFKLAARVASLCFIITISSTSSSGQFPPQITYVCQTATFWCAFQWAPDVPNGTFCYCNTVFGPVGGLSINPTGVSNAPKLPDPQPQGPGTPPSSPPKAGGEVAANDCYKGLGNCPGSFANGTPNAKVDEANGLGAGSKRTFNGSLAEGSSRDISFSLARGVSYTITGECDDDCYDLDLKLRRGTVVVDDDTEADSFPIVSVTPPSSGTYSLEVLMEGCSAEPCSYTIEIEVP